jgi:hypothetical protein
MPDNADDPDTPITLPQAARLYPLAYSTLIQAAREGRLEAHQVPFTRVWLTTRAAVERAIAERKLNPRRKVDDEQER